MLLFNVALEEKGGKKEFNNVQLWRLRVGSGWGVLGFRPRIKFMDVWSLGTAQARTAVSSTRTGRADIVGPVWKIALPLAASPPSLLHILM